MEGVDSTIKEGFIQQNPSTKDRKEMDSRMERCGQVQQSWFTSSFLWDGRMERMDSTVRTTQRVGWTETLRMERGVDRYNRVCGQ